MQSKRKTDDGMKTITIEFTNGQMFGPIKKDEITDALSRMIMDLDARIALLEASARRYSV
jgi:hypothetical protein